MYSVGVSLNVFCGDIWGLSVIGQYMEMKFDNIFEEIEGDSIFFFNQFIDLKGVLVNVLLVNGDWFRNVYWCVNVIYCKIDWQDRGEFELLFVNVEVGYNFYYDFGILFIVIYEENDIVGELQNFFVCFNNQFLKFNIYGVGLNYCFVEGCFFNVMFNKIFIEGEDDGKIFVGVFISW